MRNLNLLTLTCGCLCSVAAAHAAYSPRVGELHPDFTLPSVADRTPITLSQFRGKKVLLIHFASW